MTPTTGATCTSVTDHCQAAPTDPYDRCFAHLSVHERVSFVQGLNPGSSLDFRGVTFTQELLDELMPTVRQLGAFNEARFTGAQFLAHVDFSEISFQGPYWFDNVTFHESVTFKRSSFQVSGCFLRCRFEGAADFNGAAMVGIDFSGAQFKSADFSYLTHSGSLNFEDATFDDFVTFEHARIKTAHFTRTKFSQSRFWSTHFSATTSFSGATFRDHASFENVHFEGDIDFDVAEFRWVDFTRAQFSGLTMFRHTRFDSAYFNGASFENTVAFSMAYASSTVSLAACKFVGDFLGPVRADGLNLTNSHFQSAVRIEVAANYINLDRTRFDTSAAFHVRYATVHLTDVNPTFPITITSHHEQFLEAGMVLAENFGVDAEALGKVEGMKGVDAALIVFNDIDLRRCSFEGSYHLDQINLEGRCRFSTPPQSPSWGKAWIPLRVWTQRKVLAEERSWRASNQNRGLDRMGWGEAATPSKFSDPQDIASTYRQLRKALEDRLNEPGAADFYYGEMEMRRRDAELPRSERGLLHAYWTLSGYGLRASRSIGWLVSAMAVTVLLMMGWGLPGSEPKQEASGVIAAPGSETTLVVGKSDASLSLPFKDRYTSKRLEKSGQVVLNSVVFRSSGQDLTTSGTWIEMVSRFTEPILLGFAALAVRGRIKRS
ncbi:pentapeptide repeat-containing protein [Streptomyces bobili]|uniref:pentapeptide repeat-containing protein n=1 Tax=Streptomyces bobili TaxID=67280 RepID=UPI00381D2CED